MKKSMQLLKNYKNLKASSLVESVIAIAIISVAALVAFMVYLNVIRQNKTIYYYAAKHEVELLTQQAVMQKNYDDDEFNYNAYTINKEVIIDKNEQVAYVTFTIKTGGKTFLVNKLIPYHES